MTACFLFLFLTIVKISICEDFSVVSGVFDEKADDVLAAFGDFNADKLIDIFVISHSGRELSVLLAEDLKQFTRKMLLTNTNESFSAQNTIGGVMVADFDGDVIMDVLVSIRNPSSSDSIQIAVFWGTGSAVDVDHPYRFDNESFKGEPVLFDFNADMRPDLLTKAVNDSSLVWQAVPNQKNFTLIHFPFPKPLHLSTPHSSAFVDLDGDYNADLLLTNAKNTFEVFSNNGYNESTEYSLNESFTIGQSSFADFNQDGYIDHVVPVCKAFIQDDLCSDGFIYMLYGNNQSQWTEVAGPLNPWQFLWNVSGKVMSPFSLTLPVTLRVGDYDMDGFPDLLTVMYNKDRKTERKPILLKNVLNGTGNGRTFEMQLNAIPSSINTSILATFYDYAEDGMLDIIVTVMSNGSASATPSLVLLKNNLALDTCFLKVTVISGLCSDKCKDDGRKPYGVNVPGPTVTYETTQANGRPQKSAAGQLTQSSHFALQLPFVSLGLGQTPNFVDTVSIGIPQPKNNKVNRTKSFTQIIPNAQLIVNPFPIDEPSSWKMQLFVVPSRQIYLTGIALLLTCVVMALIVAILLWNERREDMREKKQESQRFHFDAM